MSDERTNSRRVFVPMKMLVGAFKLLTGLGTFENGIGDEEIEIVVYHHEFELVGLDDDGKPPLAKVELNFDYSRLTHEMGVIAVIDGVPFSRFYLHEEDPPKALQDLDEGLNAS